MAMIAAANGAAQLVTHAMAQKPSGQTVGYPSATQAGHVSHLHRPAFHTLAGNPKFKHKRRESEQHADPHYVEPVSGLCPAADLHGPTDWRRVWHPARILWAILSSTPAE